MKQKNRKIFTARLRTRKLDNQNVIHYFKVKLTHLPVIEDHWKHQLNSLAAFSEMVNGRTLVNKHYLKTSDFLKFREFRAISQKLILAEFLVKTSSRKLILSQNKLNSQISKFLQTSDEEEGTKILFCIQT